MVYFFLENIFEIILDDKYILNIMFNSNNILELFINRLVLVYVLE